MDSQSTENYQFHFTQGPSLALNLKTPKVEQAKRELKSNLLHNTQDFLILRTNLPAIKSKAFQSNQYNLVLSNLSYFQSMSVDPNFQITQTSTELYQMKESYGHSLLRVIHKQISLSLSHNTKTKPL